MSASDSQTINVRYTAPSSTGGPNVELFQEDGARWDENNPISVTDTTDFAFQQDSNGDGFDFTAISFWGDGVSNGNDVSSDVARTFIKFKGGVASFLGRDYISDVDMHKKDKITFTVHNLNESGESGHISLQVTINDGKIAYTSRDPHIELEDPQGR